MEGALLGLFVAKEIASGAITFYNFGNIVKNVNILGAEVIDQEAAAAAVREANHLDSLADWETIDPRELRNDFELVDDSDSTSDRRIVDLPNIDLSTEKIYYE